MAVPTQDEMDAFIVQQAADLGVPGVALGVTFQGVDYVSAHGVTSVADPLPINADTTFMIGSITKTFTATVAMCLVEQGAIDLDERVVTYLPEVGRCAKEIRFAREAVRVRDLFTHTAGWLGDVDFDTGWGEDALQRAVRDELPHVPEHVEPGRDASYNNVSAVVLARLAEVVSGVPFERLLVEWITTPLGMTRTFTSPLDVALRRHAVGHRDTDGQAVPQLDWPETRAMLPAGGVLSTVRDQLRYARFQMTGLAHPGPAPLSDTTRKRMRAPLRRLSANRFVGLNWMLTERGERTLVGHGGNIASTQLSALEMSPVDDFAVVVLTNGAPGRALRESAVTWALRTFLDMQDEPLPARARVSTRALREYTGVYGAGDSRFEVRRDGTQLRVWSYDATTGERTGSGTPVALSDGVAETADAVISVDTPHSSPGMFVRDASGSVSAFRWGMRLGHRLTEPEQET